MEKEREITWTCSNFSSPLIAFIFKLAELGWDFSISYNQFFFFFFFF